MKPSTIPWPLLFGTGITLGLGVPIAKAAAADGVGALAFTLWPTLAAGALLAGLGWRRQGRPAPPRALLRFGLVAGLVGHAAPMLALFWLAAHAGAGFAALALTLPPVFTLLVTLFVGLERPVPRRVAAVSAGLAGALLLVSGRGGGAPPDLAALVLALAIPASIGAANVYRSVRMPPGIGGEWLAAATLLTSALLLGAVASVTGEGTVPPSAAAWRWIALQTGVLVLGYQLYFALQKRAEPVTFSFIGYVMTATGVAAGTLLFGERLAWTVAPALLLIGSALWLVQRGGTPPRRAA